MWVCSELDWQGSVVPRWLDVFENAYEDLQKEIKNGTTATKETKKVIETETF